MTTTVASGASSPKRDLEEFNAKIEEAARNASPQDRAAAEAIVASTSSEPSVKVVTITPAVAALLFVLFNKYNRDFSLAKTHDYADQMLKGFWKLVHQGIAFYPDKMLADGQHRIGAVFLSDTPQPFTVFLNFQQDAMQAIDVAKRRTAGDAFGITRIVDKNDARIGASICERVMKYEELRIHTRRTTFSIYEIDEWAREHLDELKWTLEMVNRIVKGDPVLSKPEAGSICLGLRLGGYHREDVEGFLNDVIQSIGRYPESPTIDLHRQFMKAKSATGAGNKNSLTPEAKLALAFKGASLFLQRASTGGLRWKSGKEPLPAPTPPQPAALLAAD